MTRQSVTATQNRNEYRVHIREQNSRAWVEGDSDDDVSIRAGRIAWPAAHCVYSKDLEPARRSTTAAEHRIDGQEEEQKNTATATTPS